MACVLITGASGGIGQSVAEAFARNGDKVLLCGNRNITRATQFSAYLNGLGYSTAAVKGDVTNPGDVEQMFTAAENIFGSVDILVNNAGIAKQTMFQDISYAEWKEIFDVNTHGAFLCSQRALQGMLGKKTGSIINISSIWGQEGASCEVHYSAAKAALIGFSKALAKELAPSGIRVNCIAPGIIETDMLMFFTNAEKQAMCEDIPAGFIAAPDSISGLAVFLASEQAYYITGQVIGVNGGLYV